MRPLHYGDPVIQLALNRLASQTTPPLPIVVASVGGDTPNNVPEKLDTQTVATSPLAPAPGVRRQSSELCVLLRPGPGRKIIGSLSERKSNSLHVGCYLSLGQYGFVHPLKFMVSKAKP